MGIEFHKTGYARMLFEHQIPEFINQMKSITEILTKLTEKVEVLCVRLDDLQYLKR